MISQAIAQTGNEMTEEQPDQEEPGSSEVHGSEVVSILE
jgi:hypothetical protein